MTVGARRFGLACALVLTGACGGRSASRSSAPRPRPGDVSGRGGTGTGGTGTSASVGGGSSTAGNSGTGGTGGSSDPFEACVIGGVRRVVGGFGGTSPIPVGACMHNNAYYCAGEGYEIISGPCEGQCTCQGDTTFACEFLHPNTN